MRPANARRSPRRIAPTTTPCIWIRLHMDPIQRRRATNKMHPRCYPGRPHQAVADVTLDTRSPATAVDDSRYGCVGVLKPGQRESRRARSRSRRAALLSAPAGASSYRVDRPPACLAAAATPSRVPVAANPSAGATSSACFGHSRPPLSSPAIDGFSLRTAPGAADESRLFMKYVLFIN